MVKDDTVNAFVLPGGKIVVFTGDRLKLSGVSDAWLRSCSTDCMRPGNAWIGAVAPTCIMCGLWPLVCPKYAAQCSPALYVCVISDTDQ